MSCIITDEEMREEPFYIYEQEVSWVHLLKSKGAPTVGNIICTLDPDYRFTRSYDHDKGVTKISWVRK